MEYIDVDNFAGGGGASLGIETATGKPVDIAINHDPEAVAMHAANHPHTEHLCQNIFQVDPADIARRGPIRLAWFSPDCTHHSKAKGGKPIRTAKQRSKRDLAWVVVHWAERAKPQIIMLENVEEFQDWGPLGEDGRPCPKRKGKTFDEWVGKLRRCGYKVEWRELRACDYGAPTIRKRLFLIARRDGLPIVWPEPTHGPGLQPYRTAAEIIDWSLPVHSIFLSPEEARKVGVKRPLAEATMRRIARGVQRYVIDAADPFIISCAYGDSGGRREYDLDEPLGTVTGSRTHAVVTPFFTQRYGEREGQAPRTRSVVDPMQTIVPTANGANLVAAFLAQHNSGMVGHDSRKPVSTIVQRGCTQGLVAAHLLNLKGGDRRDADPRGPIWTQCAGGTHIAEVRSFLIKYYGEGGQWQDLREPLHTMTAKARLGIVTVAGVDYQIADIGMRMLSPRELFNAQGFTPDYIIDPIVNGKPLSKTAQYRQCGNSVCRHVAAAMVRVNVVEMATAEAA